MIRISFSCTAYPEWNNYPKSCLDALNKNKNAKSGYIDIYTAGDIYNVFCEQEKRGGGWTQVIRQKLDKVGEVAMTPINDLSLAYTEVMFIACKNHWFQYAMHAIAWKSKGYSTYLNYLQFSGKKYLAQNPKGATILPNAVYVPESFFKRYGPQPDQCYFDQTQTPSFCHYQFIIQSKGKLEGFGDFESTVHQYTGDNVFHYDYAIYVR